MRVIFLPVGGFNKKGAFIEIPDGQEPTGKEEQFERQGSLNLSLTCSNVSVSKSLSVRTEPDSVDLLK